MPRITIRISDEQQNYLNSQENTAAEHVRELIEIDLLDNGKCLHCSNEAQHDIVIFDKTKIYSVCDKCYKQIDKAMRKAKTSEDSCDGYKLKLDEVQ